MTEEELPLCECGCGEPVARKGNRWINGHNNRGKFKSKPEPKLCECNCGKYALPGNRFINGHNRRGHHQSATHTEKIVGANKRYYENNPEKLAEMTKRLLDASKEYWADQDNCNAMSDSKKQYYIDNPEARKAARLKAIEQWSDPETCDDQAERIRNSDAAKTARKVNQENMTGGNDICKHHYIYDHNDLSKYTMAMTRSEHGRLHRNLQVLGLEIPHINTEHENTEELKLMEYIKKIESEPKGL